MGPEELNSSVSKRDRGEKEEEEEGPGGEEEEEGDKSNRSR